MLYGDFSIWTGGVPIALLGIAFPALGIVGFYFVIMENPRLPQYFEP